ncbi:MAG: translation initiation factor IF-2 [Bacteroidetes bacterium]|nr:translation initiation factor IF-2 [Bacteroidota bacterium]
MAEKVEKKKKLYQFAKEINISHETIIEYLTKKGYQGKTVNSIVTDEMSTIILSHFKKEKETAEKHQRKIQSLRITKKAEKKPEKEEPPKVDKKAKTAKTEVTFPSEEKLEIVKEKITTEALPRAVEESIKIDEETVKGPEIVETELEFPSVERIAEEAAVKADVTKEKPKEKKHMRLIPKMGLTIKGKMVIETAAETKAAEAAKDEVKQKTTSQVEADKKKKKKKVATALKEKAIEEVDELARKKKKKKKIRHIEINQEEVESAIKRTIAEMDETVLSARALLRRKKKKEREEEELKIQQELESSKSRLKVTEFVSVNELASLMQVNVADVIKKCIELGLMVSINQRLDKDIITLVTAEFGLEIEFQNEFEERILEDGVDDEELLEPRPPVVTIMGHVDHGKTSLLDYIRRSNVVAGESGGITQHIGAYSVTLESNKSITFLDTPGHEAFTAMRARGAQLTDIVILVVAADDSVMPQTVEAISHAQAANVPIVIAINKVDKPNANTEKIRQQLSERNILVEEWGGKYQSVELSAKTGKNVDLLLEKILLEAEVLNLRANPKMKARGNIVEAQLDKGKGIVATILVKKGTLKVGDPFISGFSSGKVRAMYDERQNRVEYAKPSTPVQVTGFDTIPQAGDLLVVMDNEREAREISLKRTQLKREQNFRGVQTITLDNFAQKVQEGAIKDLKVIVKGDVDGSVGAISDSLMKIQNAEVRVNVIHKGVGAISEGDVLLAAASDAIIIGFHVRPNVNARILAEPENVEIRFYNIIYDVINDVKKALEGMLSPETKEEVMGSVEVRDIFKIPKIGTIAGCYVLNGRIVRNNKVRLLRDGIVIFEGGIESLKRFKDDVREVESGYECGIGLDGFHDIKVGDIIEPFKIVELKRKLS